MSLVDRAKNIIVSPKTEWEVIANETPDTTAIFTGYILPMAVIPVIAAVIGSLLFSGSFVIGLSSGLILLFSSIIGVFVTALIVNALAGSFGSEQNFGRALQLVAYAYTPSWVGGILAIVPPLAIIGMLFSLYGLYLLYLGLPFTMKTPDDKVVIYLIVTAIVLVVIYSILGLVFGLIIAAIIGTAILGAAATL